MEKRTSELGREVVGEMVGRTPCSRSQKSPANNTYLQATSRTTQRRLISAHRVAGTSFQIGGILGGQGRPGQETCSKKLRVEQVPVRQHDLSRGI